MAAGNKLTFCLPAEEGGEGPTGRRTKCGARRKVRARPPATPRGAVRCGASTRRDLFPRRRRRRRRRSVGRTSSRETVSLDMTSYDRYRGYVRSSPHSPYYYHQFQQQQQQQQQRQHLGQRQLDDGGTPAWRTRVPGVEAHAPADDRLFNRIRQVVPDVERAPADDGGQRDGAKSPSPAAGGARRRPPPPFTIDAILSGTGTATGSGLDVSTSGAEWPSTTAVGPQLDVAPIQLTRGKSDSGCNSSHRRAAAVRGHDSIVTVLVPRKNGANTSIAVFNVL